VSARACAAIMRTSRSTLLRCLNIPARYCTGYLGDIGVPVTDAPWIRGLASSLHRRRVHTFDPRNNQRRIGRILIARGRDAADVAISNGLRAELSSGVPGLDRRGHFRNDASSQESRADAKR